jgi:hypothetical protein
LATGRQQWEVAVGGSGEEEEEEERRRRRGGGEEEARRRQTDFTVMQLKKPEHSPMKKLGKTGEYIYAFALYRYLVINPTEGAFRIFSDFSRRIPLN